jgi:hypothetical protein
MQKIFLGMPSWTWIVNPEIIFSLTTQVIPEWYKLIFNNESIVSWQIVHRARNELVRRFLDWWYDYLLRCDDDNPPTYDWIKRLIESNKDIVSWIVPLRWGHCYNVTVNWTWLKTLRWCDEIFEIENFWTWFCLISRKAIKDVFEVTGWYPYMFSPWEFVYNTEKWCLELYDWQNDIEKYHSKDWKVIIRKWEIGEDLYFWIQAKKLWYKMYANKYATCIHYKRDNWFISVKDIEWRNQDCPSSFVQLTTE